MEICGLLKLILDIEGRNSLLLSGPDSDNVIEGVIEAAEAADTRWLAAATPIGHALCGAAVARSGGRLRLWNSGMPGPVLIVDGITASDISPKTKQTRLERLGIPASIHIVEIACRVPEDQPDDSLAATMHPAVHPLAQSPSAA